MPSPLRMLLLTVALMLTACGSGKSSAPGIQLTPVVLGGEHAAVFDKMLGPLQGYRMQYEAPFRAYRVMVETWKMGKMIKREALCVGTCQTQTEMLLAFAVLKPRREGATTELTLVMDQGDLSLTRSLVLDEWDQLTGPEQATSYAAWTAPTQLPVTAQQPILLWRWNRGKSVPLAPLTAPIAADLESSLQVSIEFDH